MAIDKVIVILISFYFFFFSSRRRHTRFDCDWSSDVCSSDLLAVATERETQTYIDSVLRQRDMVRNLEIRDREGKLVYQMQTRETVPLAPSPGAAMASPELGSRELPRQYEEELSERQQTYEVEDITVPIGDLGQ